MLAGASNTNQSNFIGNQTGGRVFLFLSTDNFERDYQPLIKNDIVIVREPKITDYGTIAVFKDLYNNLWDLIEFNQAHNLHQRYHKDNSND